MKRLTALLGVLVIAFFVAMGCSNSGGNPVTPNSDEGLTPGHEVQSEQTCLWGYYDIYLDIENQTAEAVVNRDVMYAVNVVQFLNSNPATLAFQFNDINVTPDYVDVDLDLSITHPIPNLPKFNGYDVRGILIAEGSLVMSYNSELRHSVFGVDQYMMNADGYTRWFNHAEFTTSGLFGYTKGIYSSKNLFFGDATVNPYKYFTDGLASDGDEWSFLNANSDSNGVFSSGSTNTRNYQIRFPLPTPAVQYGYAVMANWEGGQPEDHPSNAPEAVAYSVTVTDDIYYVDPLYNGGDLILDIGLFYWEELPTQLYIESTVLSAVHQLTPDEMSSGSVTDHTVSYHVEVPADSVTSVSGQEFWIIAEYSGFDYTNPFGVPNAADGDPLAAFYRNDLYVSGTQYNSDPVCDMFVVTSMPAEGTVPVEVEFDASGSTDPDGDPLAFEWDFNGDGIFPDPWIGGTPDHPIYGYMESYTGQVCVRVTDGKGGADVCCVDVVVNVTGPNLPPEIVSGVDGDPTFGPTDVKEYTVTANDPDGDTLTYIWIVSNTGTGDPVFSGPGDGAGGFTVDWGADVGALVGDQFAIDCSVIDGFNPPVGATTLLVDCVEGVVTLYLYDGTVDDGGIQPITTTYSIPTWEYCPGMQAWDEDHCNPYTAEDSRVAVTPPITFPDVGTFTKIHLEIWHWGDMQDDGFCYGSLGRAEDIGGGDYNWYGNWYYNELVYIEGFDFNEPGYDDWTYTFGSEAVPEWSHLDCSAYAGGSYNVGFQFEEYGAGNPDTQAGWNIRKLWIWVEP